MFSAIQVEKNEKIHQYLIHTYFNGKEPSPLFTIGNQELLYNLKTAIFCSQKCPGKNILRAYDFCKTLRDEGKTIIGGFTSPIEKDCFDILLRGKQPIIICPARSLQRMRIPVFWKRHIETGRLLIISAFKPIYRRITTELAQKRNNFIAVLADEAYFAYIQLGGKLEEIRDFLIKRNVPILEP
jgi:predicted Rossmann fold nucleotide-binding protein DprA/Smf involved in DNA uptake